MATQEIGYEQLTLSPADRRQQVLGGAVVNVEQAMLPYYQQPQPNPNAIGGVAVVA